MGNNRLGLQIRLIKRRGNKIIKDTGFQESRCFVKQFLQVLAGLWMNGHPNCIQADGDPTMSVTGNDTDFYENFYADTEPEDDEYGIVMGQSASAEANTDFMLGSKISHGNGLNQLHYGVHHFVEPYEDSGGYIVLVISRTFVNIGEYSVSVNEVGIYVRSYGSYFVDPDWFYADYTGCIVRDLVSESLGVGESLEAQYRFRTMV